MATELRAKMDTAFDEIWELHQQKPLLSLRTCAFILALQRVVRAQSNRGFE